MKKFRKNIDLIEQYLEGELDKSDKRQVEEQISNDKEFEQMVGDSKALLDGVKYSARKDLEATLGKWEEEMSGNTTSKASSGGVRTIRWYYIAASIVFVLIANILIFNNINNGYTDIVENYYVPYNYLASTTRGDESATSTFELIYEQYDRENYTEVIKLIDATDVALRTDRINYLLANSYQATEQFNEAVKIFKELLGSDTGFKTGTQWYLALCYLSLEKKDLALPLLEELSHLDTSSYSSKAKNVLDELK